jgi:hypothetical protein
MILYELVVGRLVFLIRTSPCEVAGAMVLRQFEPDIPENLWPETRKLISDCLAMDCPK